MNTVNALIGTLITVCRLFGGALREELEIHERTVFEVWYSDPGYRLSTAQAFIRA